MHLRALKLHGFKSFADATTLEFGPGVTAVVGPNGCGKSNIADAIRWALGEQSSKALRSGKMQDVIFEGTEIRPPAQLSEVSLVLADCEKQLGEGFHEIEVVRRGHRDGQGEYRFNGQPCRLKDIHRLFMDTGIGRTSYSVMAQGQIDQILSSKPEERRAVFEEAAGITKYKSQRREALNKLALTDQNLARVSDVVAEVGRQIASLRRQAAKAVRYKRLAHRRRHLSLAWSGFHHARLVEALRELEDRIAARRAAAAERRAELENGQAGLGADKDRRSRLLQRAQAAQESVYALRSQKDQAENAARMASVKRGGLEERLAGARDDTGEIEMQIREVAAEADSGAQDRQLQLGLLGASDAQFQERNRGLSAAEGELGQAERDLQEAKFEFLQLESAIARFRAASSGYEVDQKAGALRHEGLARELDEARRQEETAAAAAAALAARAEQALAEKSRAAAAAAAAQQALADLTRDFREAQRGLQEADRQLARRGAQLRLLQQLQERWEGFGEGAKALLQGRLDDALAGAPAVSVARGLEVKPEFGRAVAALLGAAAEAVSVSDLATARRILGQIERDRIGPVILRIEELAAGNAGRAEPPAGLIPAAAALDGAAPGHPAAALLASCYIAENLDSFLEFWRAHPDFSFLAVADRRGEVADRRGLVFGGGKDGAAPAEGIVQREIDRRETAKALAEDQKAHDERKAEADRLAERLAAAEQELESRRTEMLGAAQNAAAPQAAENEARRGLEETSERRRKREEELAAIERERDEAQARWAKARADLTEAEGKLSAQRQEIERRETRVAEARAGRDAQRELLAQARLELAERRQKVEVLDRGLGEMEKRRGQLADLLDQRRREIGVWTEQIAGFEAEAEAERARSARLGETLAVAERQVEEVRAELVAAESEIAEREAALAGLRAEADRAQEELSALEIRAAQDRQRAQFMVEEAAREFQAELAAVAWKDLLWRAGDDPADLPSLDLEEEEAGGPKLRRRKDPSEADLAALEAANWEEIRAEAEALRQRLEGMGAVNLVAIEEYAELRQRHEFLEKQVADLTAAKAELVRAIDEINRTSQEQFDLTFGQIRKNFAYTFEFLFGGGRAALELIDTGDVLESGIEIVAQPPGTKLMSVSLLSGGQRALAAIALLFALYMVKPSPFCLLDEIDAPLDESNIGRFTELLQRFVSESQFVIITHNKRTVAAAKAIYGITMQERGVSKVVSMRFNQERGEAETQPAPNLAEAVAKVTA